MEDLENGDADGDGNGPQVGDAEGQRQSNKDLGCTLIKSQK